MKWLKGKSHSLRWGRTKQSACDQDPELWRQKELSRNSDLHTYKLCNVGKKKTLNFFGSQVSHQQNGDSNEMWMRQSTCQCLACSGYEINGSYYSFRVNLHVEENRWGSPWRRNMKGQGRQYSVTEKSRGMAWKKKKACLLEGKEKGVCMTARYYRGLGIEWREAMRGSLQSDWGGPWKSGSKDFELQLEWKWD